MNNQIPTKFSNKLNRINWDELKKIENDSKTIETLHDIHGRCSGGALHNGTENDENPIDKEELEEMLQNIQNIQNIHKMKNR